MRIFRAPRLARLLALAAALSVPTVIAAQENRPFTDAWFWGIKGGAVSYGTVESTNRIAPTIGIDWLITRTQGGIYLAYDHGFLSERGRIADEDAGNDGERVVRLKGLHRATIAAMVFPGQPRTLRPYAGLGFALHRIGTATAEGEFAREESAATAADAIAEYRATFTPTLIGGAQMRYSFASAFAQATFAAAQERFFLHGGRSFLFGAEVGLRYNIGRSIDRGR